MEQGLVLGLGLHGTRARTRARATWNKGLGQGLHGTRARARATWNKG